MPKRRARRWLSASCDRIPVVLDDGEGIVEMMKERLPLRVPLRRAETGVVVIERPPADKEDVASFSLDAGAHFQAKKSFTDRNQRQRFGKRLLERRRFARPDVENRVLDNHGQE